MSPPSLSPYQSLFRHSLRRILSPLSDDRTDHESLNMTDSVIHTVLSSPLPFTVSLHTCSQVPCPAQCPYTHLLSSALSLRTHLLSVPLTFRVSAVLSLRTSGCHLCCPLSPAKLSRSLQKPSPPTVPAPHSDFLAVPVPTTPTKFL